MAAQAGSNRSLLRMALYSSAVMFGGMGLICFLQPETVEQWLGFDAMITNILGGALLCSAAADILVAKFLFKDRETK